MQQCDNLNPSLPGIVNSVEEEDYAVSPVLACLCVCLWDYSKT